MSSGSSRARGERRARLASAADHVARAQHVVHRSGVASHGSQGPQVGVDIGDNQHFHQRTSAFGAATGPSNQFLRPSSSVSERPVIVGHNHDRGALLMADAHVSAKPSLRVRSAAQQYTTAAGWCGTGADANREPTAALDRL